MSVHEPAAAAAAAPSTDFRPFPVWRRVVALLLDVLLFAPPIAFFCVAGSFATEATRHAFSGLYACAFACALALPACEIFAAGTPGLLIMKGRIRRSDGSRASVRRTLLRTFLKYAPLAAPYVVLGAAVGLDALGLRQSTIVFAVAIALVLVLTGYLVLSIVRSARARRAYPAWWFDHYADTRVTYK